MSGHPPQDDDPLRLRSAVPLSLLVSAAILPLTPRVPPHRPAAEEAPLRVAINDNRRPAGVLRSGVLTLRLDARLGEWHPDGEDAPGAIVPAFVEEGGAPSIPGPLVRVPAGTEVVATVRNSLAQTLTLRGLHSRAAAAGPGSPMADVVELAPGVSRTVRFRLDTPGTYYYYGSTKGLTVNWRFGEDAQLTGAIVVDPPGAAPVRDRVIVLGIWSDTVGRAFSRRTRILAVVNGRSWPHTERFAHEVGDTVRWRVINASTDSHPMHLHGFYYMVDGRGDGRADTTYASADRRRVNTEAMSPGTTFTMTWIPERAGNWLFHCHLPEHFGARGPLGMPRSAAKDGHHASVNHAREGMSGLVIGVTVRSPRVRVAARDAAPRPPRQLRLLVRQNPGSTAEQPFYAFALQQNGSVPPTDSGLRIGPVIVVTRDEPVNITVVNTLDEPTAVHWHGIELESYFDGVAGFSGAGRRLSPIIAARDSFVVRFTPPRAGTFIYHTHIDETRQQLAGLAGALIVMEPGSRRDPATDHVILITTPRDSAAELRSVLLNGSATPTSLTLRAGVVQRLRFINITTRRPNIRVELWRDTSLLSWRALAKDGADLPEPRQVWRPAWAAISVGETMDYELMPEASGDMRVVVRAATGAELATLPIRVRAEP